ncbi:MAG TPA: hypothetical protein EYN66_18220 [Myxococcales bacterium]|nr:hypothetical protein [Myxococcales bacterium]
MALTQEQEQTLNEYGDLYRRFRNRDIFSGAGETLAAVSDIVSGRATASSLITKYNGELSANEQAKRRNELLKELAGYQKARRDDITKRDSERQKTIREQLKSVTDQRRWAMEQEVALEKTRMTGQAGIEAAELNKLAAMMASSDREYEQGNFGPVINAADARSRLSESTAAKLDTLLVSAETHAVGVGGIPDDQYATLISDNLIGIPSGEREYVIAVLQDETSGGYSYTEFFNRLSANDDAGKALRAGHAGKQILRMTKGANTDMAGRKTKHRQWKEGREREFEEFSKGHGVGVSASLRQRLKDISDATPEEMERKVNALMENLPEDLQGPAQDRALPEDAYTRRINDELDKLADPRNNWAGSRHQKIRQQIESSGEYRQWAAETYGGAYDPDEAFKRMIAETKTGMASAPVTANTMQQADAATGIGSAYAYTHGPKGAASQGLAGAMTPQESGGFSMVTDEGKAPDLAQTYAAGRKRQLMKSLGKSAGVALPDSSAASALAASSSALAVGRLRKVLKTEEDND